MSKSGDLRKYGTAALADTGSGANNVIAADASGNVGIGTNSPSTTLDVTGTLNVTSATTVGNHVKMGNGYSYGWDDLTTRISGNSATDLINMYTAGSERLRIDSSGNFLLGKTSTSSGTAGIRFATQDPGYSEHTRAAGTVMYLNRLTSEGQMVAFASGNTAFGGIGVSGGNNLYISGSASLHAGLTFATQAILPTTEGTANHEIVDLGSTTNRFKNLHLSGGVVFASPGGAGTSTSTTLDEYEEGTWTPVASSGTNSVSHASYTRIGNRVYITMEISLNGTRSSSGALNISGLPFTVANWTASTCYVQNYNYEGTRQLHAAYRASGDNITFIADGTEVVGTHISNGYVNVSGFYTAS